MRSSLLSLFFFLFIVDICLFFFFFLISFLIRKTPRECFLGWNDHLPPSPSRQRSVTCIFCSVLSVRVYVCYILDGLVMFSWQYNYTYILLCLLLLYGGGLLCNNSAIILRYRWDRWLLLRNRLDYDNIAYLYSTSRFRLLACLIIIAVRIDVLTIIHRIRRQ